MAIIIALALQKGGVGKTTTTAALGMELAQAGARVLVVDLDPQGNLTQALGVTVEPGAPTVYEAMIDAQQTGAAIIRTAFHAVALLPATLRLAGAEMRFAAQIGRELLLRDALDTVRAEYDVILIDSPPSLGLFTVNVLAAADTVLVPLQAHIYALGAMEQLQETIGLVRKLNTDLHVGGIVVTMSDRRTSVNREVEAAARDRYGPLVFTTVIPFSVKLIEAPVAGQPIAAYAAHSAGANAYAALAQEVRQRWL